LSFSHEGCVGAHRLLLQLYATIMRRKIRRATVPGRVLPSGCYDPARVPFVRR
jgi:hypothetical protein